MNYDWLAEPISADAPCGPDLAEVDDVFIGYYYDAEARMPERYFTPGIKGSSIEGGGDRLFDPKSIDHKAERKQIEALLKRSRDVRLTTLLARFQCLAGRLTDFTAAVVATANLLEAFPTDVHPQIVKNASDRRAALEELANVVTVGMPLQYMPLTPDRTVTYRSYLVASGQSEARAGEKAVPVSDLVSALSAPTVHDSLRQIHQDLTTAATSLKRIETACKSLPDTPFTVELDRTLRTISDIQSFIRLAYSDWPLWSDESHETAHPPTADVPLGTSEDGAADGLAEATPVQAATVPTGSPIRIETQTAAGHALQAVERYFGRHEPSSAALLLVTQSRLLIGKPLIEALETLLPEHAKRAVIDFGPETGFALSMERLRSLSAELPKGLNSGEDASEVFDFVVDSRRDAAQYILGVEEFFRRKEPTSPIPILLQRARSYLDKDFNAIVSELIPTPPKA